MSTRLLICDDHAMFRDCLRMLLDAQPGFVVVGEAGDQREVLREARTHRPHVVLMDLNMPGGSSIDTIRQLIGEHRNLRVLVLSMHDDPSFLRAAFAAGAVAYVLKRSAYSSLTHALLKVRAGGIYIDPSLRVADTPELARGTSPPLSPREREVLVLLASGLSYREAGERLGMGERTVETHRRHIADKLGLRTRADLIRYALEIGLIAPGQEAGGHLKHS